MKQFLLCVFLLAHHVAMGQLSILAQNPNGSPASDNFSVFAKVGGRIVFNQGSVDNWLNSSGLWQSDGTPEGTSLLNANLRMTPGAPYHNCVVGNRLFFAANGGLWRTDGTPDGTGQVIDNYTGNGMAALDTILIFSVPAQNNSETTPSGLWRSDGTATGTFKIADITAQFLVSASLEGFLYFMASETDGAGYTFWRTDGTTAGTTKFSSELDTPWGFARLGDKLIFKARYHHEPVTCNRGTPENPILENHAQQPEVIMQIQDGALSIIKEPTYTEYRPYGADGCMVKDYHPIFNNSVNFFSANGLLFFLGQEVVPHAMNNLWRTDGTSGGTVKLTNFPDGDEGVNYNYFSTHVFLDRGHTNLMYFSAHTAEHGSELWRSDGTPQGTFMLKDVNPGNANSYPSEMRTVNDVTYFFAYNPQIGQELWKTNGTPEGTVLVTDLNPGPGDAAYRRDFNSEPYNFFGTSLGDDYIFGGITGPTASLFTTKNITAPPTLKATLTEYVGGCGNCEITLSKTAGPTGRNHYDLFTRGHFSTPVADKYNIVWNNERWNLRLLTRNSGTIIDDWQQTGPQSYNGLNTSPKPPCTGWSNGVLVSGDCQVADVSISGTGAPALNIASIRSLGIINGKNAYELPVEPGQEGENVTIEWDGVKWVIKHIIPSARTWEDIVLSENSLDYGANPPCGSWSNGYALTGAVCNISSLPVTLISFSAQKSENYVLLNWTTSLESNSDRFEIQRSNDGKIWQLLGSVAAGFESQQLSNYQYVDRKPANGSNLYRLKMIDRDSSFSLSRYQNVNMETTTAPFPNPAIGQLTFKLSSMASARIRVVDLTGRTLIERTIKQPPGSSEISLDVSSLSSGLYVLHILGPDFQEHSRFVKK